MQQVFRHYQRYQGLRAGVSSLPPWGRTAVLVAALPGAVLLAGTVVLSIVLLLVSILALFLLTVPVYRVVRWLTGGRERPSDGNEVVTVIDPAEADYGSPGRKPVQGTLIE